MFLNEITIMALTSGLATIIGTLYNLLFPPKVRANIPFSLMMKQSGSIFVSSLAVNKSMSYVPFLVMSMTKSCSLLSVIVVGVFFTGVKSQQNKIHPSKFVVAGLICLGTLVFQLAGTKTLEESSTSNQLIGFSLLLISLVSDGILPDIQAQTKELYNPTAMELY